MLAVEPSQLPFLLTSGNVDAAIVRQAEMIFAQLAGLPFASRVATLNALRKALHEHSPFRTEPVDCIQWVESDRVRANDYNPNSVAPPEMQLLEHSIAADGYTQPVVTWMDDAMHEVVDGFHRTRVAKESAAVRERLRGYLPVVIINAERHERGDRIAATIRHNRARGKHQVSAMSDIVVELKRRNWTDAKIGKELGMDPDEVLRLCQVSGLAELFAEQEFSKSWDVGAISESELFDGTDTDNTQLMDEPEAS